MENEEVKEETVIEEKVVNEEPVVTEPEQVTETTDSEETNSVEEPVNATPNAAPVKVKKKKGNAVASLVLGICSLVCCSIGGILGIIGLINGIVGVKKKQKKGLAVTGIVLSSLGIVVGLIVFVGTIIGFTMFGSTIIGVIKFAQSPAGQGIGAVLSGIDMNEIDPDNLEESIKQQMLEGAADAAADYLNEQISSEDGLTIHDANGNEYTIQGESLSEATIVDESTGEEINVGEYVDAIQSGKEEFMTSLEEEYGITEDDLTKLMEEMSGEAGMEVDAETWGMLLDMLDDQ